MVARARIVLGLALVTALTAGCAVPQSPTLIPFPVATSGPVTPTLTPTPLIQLTLSAGTPGAGDLTPDFDPYVYAQNAISLLADALNVPESDVLFVGILPAEWPDSSLGCPQPGQAYLQVVTPGYIILLEVGTDSYEVHSDQPGNMVLCLNPSGTQFTPTPPDPVVAEFIIQARTDLAGRLGISPDEVVVVRSEAVDWSNGSLGCEERGQTYSPGPISGYRIILAVDETYYEYHTDFQRMILCDEPTE